MLFVTIVISVVALAALAGFVINTRRLHHRTLERDAYRQLVHLQERPATGSRPDLRIARALALLLAPLWWLRDKLAEHPARLAGATGFLAGAGVMIGLLPLLPDDRERSVASAPPSTAPSRPGTPAPPRVPDEAPDVPDAVERNVSEASVASPLVGSPELTPEDRSQGDTPPVAGDTDQDGSSSTGEPPVESRPPEEAPEGEEPGDGSRTEPDGPSTPIDPDLEQSSDPRTCVQLRVEPVAEAELCLEVL